MAAKWEAYYSKQFLPWDSGIPSSQLVAFLTSCNCAADPLPAINSSSSSSSSSDPEYIQRLVKQAEAAPIALPPEPTASGLGQPVQLHTCEHCEALKPPAAGRVLELGCGTGASAVWMAAQGYHVTAVDIVQSALDAAAKRAALPAGAGVLPNKPTFIRQHIMQLCSSNSSQPHTSSYTSSSSSSSSVGTFDMIYDCQVYHALVKDDAAAQAQLPQLLYSLLKPGGLLLMLTGNANEPEVGPAVLTGQELLAPLLEAGLECVLLRQSRFDATPYYVNVLGKRPLAWWVVLQRPRQ